MTAVGRIGRRRRQHKRMAAMGRRRSIRYRAEMGSSGWIADLRESGNERQVAPIPDLPAFSPKRRRSDFLRTVPRASNPILPKNHRPSSVDERLR